MELVLIGLNHKTAPIDVRERIAFPEDHLPEALRSLRQDYRIREGIIISTCNRVEILAEGRQSPTQTAQLIKDFLYAFHSLHPPFLENYLYTYRQDEAIRHIFRVASSLDSMVVGEPQILAQLKQAYAVARRAGSVGTHLQDLLPRAFFVAKRIRNATRIGTSAVSTSSVAVELARKIFGDLQGKTVLLLGAGKMGKLAARNLVASGANRILCANRTLDRAREMAAQFRGEPLSFDDLPRHLRDSDIVLVSTGSRSSLLDVSLMQRIIRERKYRPLFIIDIAVPRNVSPEVNQIENIFLYDIDDLQSVIEANIQERQAEAEVAEGIVEEEVGNFSKHRTTRSIGPLLGAIRRRIEEICLQELDRHRQGLPPREYERLEKILRQTARRIAHPLITEIKRPDDNPHRRHHTLQVMKKVFDLDDP